MGAVFVGFCLAKHYFFVNLQDGSTICHDAAGCKHWLMILLVMFMILLGESISFYDSAWFKQYFSLFGLVKAVFSLILLGRSILFYYIP